MKIYIVLLISLIILVGCKNSDITTTDINKTSENALLVDTTDLCISNHQPVLFGANDITYHIGDVEPNLKDGVTAYDEEDGDLTYKIFIYYRDEIDYTKPGVYTIYYQVSDLEHRSSERIAVTLTIKNK